MHVFICLSIKFSGTLEDKCCLCEVIVAKENIRRGSNRIILKCHLSGMCAMVGLGENVYLNMIFKIPTIKCLFVEQ